MSVSLSLSALGSDSRTQHCDQLGHGRHAWADANSLLRNATIDGEGNCSDAEREKEGGSRGERGAQSDEE